VIPNTKKNKTRKKQQQQRQKTATTSSSRITTVITRASSEKSKCARCSTWSEDSQLLLITETLVVSLDEEEKELSFHKIKVHPACVPKCPQCVPVHPIGRGSFPSPLYNLAACRKQIEQARMAQQWCWFCKESAEPGPVETVCVWCCKKDPSHVARIHPNCLLRHLQDDIYRSARLCRTIMASAACGRLFAAS